MQALWSKSGWNVRWVKRAADIAKQVGLDESVVSEPLPEATLEQLVGPLRDDEITRTGIYFTLLAVREEHSWLQRVVYGDVGFLAHGPSILEQLRSFPDLADLRRYHALRPFSLAEKAMAFDGVGIPLETPTGAKKLPLARSILTTIIIEPRDRRVQVAPYLPPQWASRLEARWSGWAFSVNQGRLPNYFEYLGEPMPDDLQSEAVPPPPQMPAPLEEPRSKPTQNEGLTRVAGILLAYCEDQECDDETDERSPLPRGSAAKASLRELVDSLQS